MIPKFKVYDKSLKKFDSRFVDHYSSRNGIVGFIKGFVDFRDRFVYLQYTGKHDKNGDEIYDGHILKGSCGYFYIVKYLEDAARFVLNDVYWDMDLTDEGLGSLEDFEIVGNVYENRELLVKKV